MDEDFVYIGKIVNTHGIKGEIRILSDFEKKELVFKKGFKLYLGRKKELVVVNSYRHHKTFEMITMDGYTNINDVLRFKGLYVYFKKEDLELNEDEYLDIDLIDSVVFNNDQKIGIVTDIRKVNLNKLIEIDYNGKQVLIPYNNEFIIKFDKTKKELYLKEIGGLLDL